MSPRLPVLGLVLVLAGCSATCPEGRICTIAGTGDLGFNGDGPALDSFVASPTSVGVDPDGVPFVVDYSNMRVRTIEDGQIETVVGNGIHAYSEEGVRPLDTPLENPVDATWGPDGLFYILPQHEGRVIRIDEGGFTEVCVATGVLDDTGDGGDALDAEMGYGGGIVVASDGRIFVADQTFSRVRRVDVDGVIDTVLGTGSGGIGPLSTGPETPIRNPERLALDEATNTLYVADTGNHRVLSVDLDSLDVERVAGTGERGFSSEATAAETRLDGPVGVLVTEEGGLLVSDLGNDRILHVATDGSVERVAGGNDEDTRPRRRATPDRARIDGPAGMAWTPEGDLLIAERTGQRVLRWVGAADALQ